MAEIPVLDSAALRALLRRRIDARSHWIVLFTAAEDGHLSALVDAIDAAYQRGLPSTRVDVWMLNLVTVDPEAGSEEALGPVCFVSWPRPAMAAETLHDVLTRVFGHEIPIALLLERPIVVPVTHRHMWQTGEQVKHVQAWLFDEKEDS